MPCKNPLYRVLLPPSVTGGAGDEWRTMTANNYLKYKGVAKEFFQMPCGQCQACRIAIAKEWTGRIVMEQSQWESSYFVTLTYNREHVPITSKVTDLGEYIEEMTLDKHDVQKFMKDLRKYWKLHYDHDNIRYYCGGEYGEQHLRPHYHLCLFNLEIPDLMETGEKNELGDPYYFSKIINKIWGKGEVVIGELNSTSAGYTARYVMKKWKGKHGLEQWEKEHAKIREFSMMSRKPGIGSKYFDEHKEKMLRDGKIYVGTEAGAYLATTPKSFVYKCRNPGITAKDQKQRVSWKEDQKNRKLGYALAERNAITINALEKQKLHGNSLDYETVIAHENEVFEQKILALRQKGFTT